MSGFLVETHLHTSPPSACSDTRGRDYIPRYIDAGYDAIIITDHFWGGNCGIDRSLPWKDFVAGFCSGYEDALNEGLKRGFPVFFGWEETFEGDDYLVYGLDKQWLLNHPEVTHWSRRDQFEQVRAAGGCVVQAHPFRAASYIHTIHLAPELCDGIEIVNMGNQQPWNQLAIRYASLLGLPVTAGSDNHHADRMTPDKLAGVILDQPLTSIHDYVSILRNKVPFRLHIPVPIPPWTPDIRPDLPCVWHDRQENDADVDVPALLERGILRN